MEREKNNTGLVVAVTILAMLVVGLVGFIIYDKVINKPSEPGIDKIEVTVELEKNLRQLIPTVKYCNQYFYKQYNGNVFYNTDLTEEDKTSDFEQCQGILYVNNLSYKNESDNNFVYIYDYVLLYDMEGGDNDCIYCAYGKDYKNINILYDDVEIINDKVSEQAIRKYGQIYKYTFKLVDNGYEYISTTAIK